MSWFVKKEKKVEPVEVQGTDWTVAMGVASNLKRFYYKTTTLSDGSVKIDVKAIVCRAKDRRLDLATGTVEDKYYKQYRHMSFTYLNEEEAQSELIDDADQGMYWCRGRLEKVYE